jgi:hypothetical protein
VFFIVRPAGCMHLNAESSAFARFLREGMSQTTPKIKPTALSNYSEIRAGFGFPLMRLPLLPGSPLQRA